MGFTDRYLRMRVVAAEPEKVLSQLIDSNIELLDVIFLDLLTVTFQVRKQQAYAVQKIVAGCGGSCRVTGRKGIFWNLQIMWKRPVLAVGMFIFFILTSLVNDRIFFVKVQGNEFLSDRVILAEAEKYGVAFGAKASLVRSEDIKNKLLQHFPQLQWVGVTTSGAVATIQVQERSIQNELIYPQTGVSHIIASQDGVISQMTVYKGNPLFQVGQSVKTGDLLVSGYIDCGIVQIGERAQAEVFAHTFRTVDVYAPTPSCQRGECCDIHTCIMFRLGKKVINLCNHSGISDATCVKMYEEDYWTLPGGFRLPVSVIKVQTFSYGQTEAEYTWKTFETWLSQFTRSYVSGQMIAGSILDEDLIWNVDDRLCVLKGSFACHEMIAQVKDEEIIGQNAEDN